MSEQDNEQISASAEVEPGSIFEQVATDHTHTISDQPGPVVDDGQDDDDDGQPTDDEQDMIQDVTLDPPGSSGFGVSGKFTQDPDAQEGRRPVEGDDQGEGEQL